MSELHHTNGRSARLERVLHDLLGEAPEFQAAAVVSFDGLPMASALPHGMDEDRVAAMSAALLSLGERAADNFGRGALSQVYVEGENGTVFLVSADDEAVLVAVGAKGAKVGLLMFEVRRSAARVAEALRADDAAVAEAEEAVRVSYAAEVAVIAPPVEVVEVVEVPEVVHVPEVFEVVAPEPEPVAELAPVEPVPAPLPVPEPAPVDYGTYIEPATPYYAEPVAPVSPWSNPLTSVAPSEVAGVNGHNGTDHGNWSNQGPAQPDGGTGGWS